MKSLGRMALPLIVITCCFAQFAGEPPHKDFNVYEGSYQSTPKAILFSFPKLSLVYDASTCGLVAAWEGSSPNPETTDGVIAQGEIIYHYPTIPPRWILRRADGDIPVQIRFLETFFKEGGRIGMRCAIQLEEGHEIEVTEIPKYDDHYGAPGIYRSFIFRGLPDNTALFLPLSGGYVREEWFPAGGDGKLEGKPGHLTFRQEVDGASRIKVSWLKD